MAQTARVMIVEDVVLMALDLKELLNASGYEVVGPAHDVASALSLVERQPMEAALLDVNLDGERSDTIADRLAEKEIPFAFITGYSESGLPQRHRDRPLITKPFALSKLVQQIQSLLQPEA